MKTSMKVLGLGGRGGAPLLALGALALVLSGAAQAQPGGVLTTLHNFTGADGGNPYGGVVLDGGGNLYGTASTGGAKNAGIVFEISAAGAFSTLYTFANGNDGGNPNAAVTLAPDGSFYGTARDGSPGDSGTVFHLTAAGAFTTLYQFTGNSNSDGGNPAAALVLGTDGNYYGSTASGGDNSTAASSIFRITPAGTFTILHSFSFGADGGAPYGQLVQGTDGSYYGTTSVAGAGNAGTVFKLTAGGVFSTLYSFTGGADGAAPEGGLLLAKDGNFYGTTSSGHGLSGNSGTVFRITPAGVLTTLYSFSGGADGDAPQAALAQGTDGNFYGTTAYGGAHGDGTVFQITPAGVLSTLYSFTGGADGEFPMASLVQGGDGGLYGTTLAGGTANSGTVYKLMVVANGGSSSSSGGSSSSSSGSSGGGTSSSSSSSSSGGGGSSSGGGSFNWVTLTVLGLLGLGRRR